MAHKKRISEKNRINTELDKLGSPLFEDAISFQSRLVSALAMAPLEKSEYYTPNRTFLQTFERLREATPKQPYPEKTSVNLLQKRSRTVSPPKGRSKVNPLPSRVQPKPGLDILQSGGTSSTLYRLQPVPPVSLTSSTTKPVPVSSIAVGRKRNVQEQHKQNESTDEEGPEERFYRGMYMLYRTAHQRISAYILKKKQEMSEKRRFKR